MFISVLLNNIIFALKFETLYYINITVLRRVIVLVLILIAPCGHVIVVFNNKIL